MTTDESGAIILKVAQPWVIIPPFDSRGVGGKTNLQKIRIVESNNAKRFPTFLDLFFFLPL